MDKKRLVKTNDGFMVTRKVFSFASGYLSKKLSSSNYSRLLHDDFIRTVLFNDKKTSLLGRELDIPVDLTPKRENYSNQISSSADIDSFAEGLKNKYKKQDLVFVYPKYEISDDIIPDMFKEAGVKIKRNIIPMTVKWNEKSNELDCYVKEEKNYLLFPNMKFSNKKKVDVFGGVSSAYANGGNCYVNDYVLIMSKEDYNTAKSNLPAVNSIERGMKQSDIGKEACLAFVLNKFVHRTEKNRDGTVAHELKHLLNHFLIYKRNCEPNVGSVSLEDKYKIEMHNEISADLADTFSKIEKYHKSQDYENIEIFENNLTTKWLGDKLRDTPVEKRKDLVMNLDFIINGNMSSWEENRAELYCGAEKKKRFKRAKLRQVDREVENHTYSAPVLRIEKDEKEYLFQRSLMYCYDIYNPDTKKKELVDVSPYIKGDVKIPSRDNDRFFKSLYLQLKLARNSLKKHKITKDIVDDCRKEISNKRNDNKLLIMEKVYDKLYASKN